MSRVDLNQALTPSILDRLVDPDSTGTAARSGYGVEQVIFSVRRDLEDLLNTHRSIIHLPQEFPEILKSPVGYGIPDFASLSTSTVQQRESIARMVAEIITRFEPRLREVTVHVIDDNRGVDHHLSVRFQIEARLRVEPYPDISFETVMELTTGCTQIRTMKT
jgi:type VI secretion system protein ImpF